MDISIECLTRFFDYNAATGEIAYKDPGEEFFATTNAWKRHVTLNVGKRAGARKIDRRGYMYRTVSVRGKVYLEHRVIWAIVFGYPIPEKIDHINRDATDNRLCNLRDGTFINDKNRWLSPFSTTGLCGVTWHKQAGKFQAAVKLAGKNHHLGLYEDKYEAFEAAQEFRLKNGFDPTHGQPNKGIA